LPSVRRK
jgi:hypothetical protein